ncbi:hypothetical protein TNCT_7741 [Trichonephila clavata]|uniref:Uncharacterized protein n=1 Tax=Trichonephila clavata TaxID=2740835 RepID=A0A8X6G9Q9_TRICU|nr:hypothetical protein TNCT_7741 [Trichonephila clavata]
MPRNGVNFAENFYCVSGKITCAAQKRTNSPVVKTAYFLYFRLKKKDRLQYPCIPSAILPVPHSADMPIPDSPKKYEIVKDYAEKKENSLEPGTSHDPDI